MNSGSELSLPGEGGMLGIRVWVGARKRKGKRRRVWSKAGGSEPGKGYEGRRRLWAAGGGGGLQRGTSSNEEETRRAGGQGPGRERVRMEATRSERRRVPRRTGSQQPASRETLGIDDPSGLGMGIYEGRLTRLKSFLIPAPNSASDNSSRKIAANT